MLDETGRRGVVRYTMRGRTHLAVLRVAGGVLVVQNIAYPDQLRKLEFASLQREVDVDRKAVKLMTQLMESMVAEFDAADYVDTYAVKVSELIDAKAAGVPMTPGEEAEAAEDVSDLLQALTASIDQKGAAKSAANHPAGKRRRTRKTAA